MWIKFYFKIENKSPNFVQFDLNQKVKSNQTENNSELNKSYKANETRESIKLDNINKININNKFGNINSNKDDNNNYNYINGNRKNNSKVNEYNNNGYGEKFMSENYNGDDYSYDKIKSNLNQRNNDFKTNSNIQILNDEFKIFNEKVSFKVKAVDSFLFLKV